MGADVSVVWSWLHSPRPCFLLSRPERKGEKPEDAATTEAANDRPAQKAMRKLAGEVELKVLGSDGAQPRSLKLRPEPVMSYGDETRFIKDSTLWVWMDGNRPALFQKLEVNDWNPGSPLWTWCLRPRLPGPVEGRWPGVANGIQTKGPSLGRRFQRRLWGRRRPPGRWRARSLNRRFAAADDSTVLRASPGRSWSSGRADQEFRTVRCSRTRAGRIRISC